MTILQGTNNANGGTVSGRTGVAVWNSCLLLSRLLDILGSDILKGKVVLELGESDILYMKYKPLVSNVGGTIEHTVD